MFVDRKGSYDVPCDNLFIPCDHIDALDPQELLVASMDPLRVPDALDA